MWRRAMRSVSASVLPECVSSALPSNTRKPDHQSTCETRIEQRGSRRRFLNFAGVSVMEAATPAYRGCTVTMLSCGMPVRLNDVSTPCGLSWRNCSICGGSGRCVGMLSLLSVLLELAKLEVVDPDSSGGLDDEPEVDIA